MEAEPEVSEIHEMAPKGLISELEETTCELLAVSTTDLDRAQQLLAHRAGLLTLLAQCEIGALTPEDVLRLRAACRDGDRVRENLILRRRSIAGDLYRLSQVRSTLTQPARNTISFSG